MTPQCLLNGLKFPPTDYFLPNFHSINMVKLTILFILVLATALTAAPLKLGLAAGTFFPSHSQDWQFKPPTEVSSTFGIPSATASK